MGERRQAFAVRCIRSIYIIFAEGLGKVKENSSHKKKRYAQNTKPEVRLSQTDKKINNFSEPTQFPANQIRPSAPIL
jgi:hypothetical protein